MFVHGINSNAFVAWGGTSGIVEKLQNTYNSYYQGRLWNPSDPSQINTPQNPYLQSYDYGGSKYAGTFNSISSNAWGNENFTLERAIDEVATAYIQNYEKKDVILVAHGMGGLLARYYLRQKEIFIEENPEATPEEKRTFVRRLVTLGTPHEGTPYANLLNDAGTGGALLTDRFFLILDIAIFGKAATNGKKLLGFIGKFRNKIDLFNLIGGSGSSLSLFVSNWKNHAGSQGLQNISANTAGKSWIPGIVKCPYWGENPFLNDLNGENYPYGEYVHTIFKRKFLPDKSSTIELPIMLNYTVGGYKDVMGAILGDKFVSQMSQEGRDVYGNITPILSYDKGVCKWGDESYSYFSSHWKGDHFSSQTTNIEAVLQGIDGVRQYDDKADISKVEMTYLAITKDGEEVEGVQDSLDIDKIVVTEEKTKNNIPYFGIEPEKLKFKISFLVGIKGNPNGIVYDEQKDEEYINKGQEYLPASMTVKMEYFISDKFIENKDDLKEKKWHFFYDTIEGEATEKKLVDSQCYIDTSTGWENKFASYETLFYQKFYKSIVEGDYVYFKIYVENPAGVPSEEKYFVFKVQNSFDISCNVTRHCYEVQEKHSINLSIENKLSHSLTEAALFLYKKTDDGKTLIAQHNGLLTINSGETYIWNIAETTDLTAGEEEEHPLMLECVTNIDGEIKVVTQTVKPKVNKIVYYNMNHDGYIVEHAGDRVVESSGFIGLQFGKESFYLIHKHIFRRYCTFSIPDRYIGKSIDRMYLELYGQAPNGFDLEIYESDYYADGTFSTGDWSNYDAQIPGSQDTVYFPVNEAVEIEIDAKNALFSKYVSLEPLSVIFKKGDEDEAPPPMDIGDVELKDLHLFEICLVVEFED